MRGKAHIGGIRQRPVTPGRRVLVLALSLLMLLASFPMDVTAAVLDRIAAPGVVSETMRNVAVTDALGNTTSYEYDALGRRVAMVDALGRRAEYVFDALGRQVVTVHPDGSSTSVGYDGCGRRVSSTDRTGRETPSGANIHPGLK